MTIIWTQLFIFFLIATSACPGSHLHYQESLSADATLERSIWTKQSAPPSETPLRGAHEFCCSHLSSTIKAGALPRSPIPSSLLPLSSRIRHSDGGRIQWQERFSAVHLLRARIPSPPRPGHLLLASPDPISFSGLLFQIGSFMQRKGLLFFSI